MEKETKTFLPDGYVHIDEVVKDIAHLIYMHNGNIMLVRSLNLLITKLNVAKEIISYMPKLPLYQIEQVVKKACIEDPYMHGMHLILLFKKRSQITDFGKVGKETVNIE
ncbi:hypothetical protein [uncultured Maribacter sp.]|uniref:hypothetical protein n=1 Tax=uncultured Maribacter sp. TaxID=431308 RepID=UPI0026124CD6|nr:hypothetical protein [uncultured Maribacter sp.]